MNDEVTIVIRGKFTTEDLRQRRLAVDAIVTNAKQQSVLAVDEPEVVYGSMVAENVWLDGGIW